MRRLYRWLAAAGSALGGGGAALLLAYHWPVIAGTPAGDSIENALRATSRDESVWGSFPYGLRYRSAPPQMAQIPRGEAQHFARGPEFVVGGWHWRPPKDVTAVSFDRLPDWAAQPSLKDIRISYLAAGGWRPCKISPRETKAPFRRERLVVGGDIAGPLILGVRPTNPVFREASGSE